MERTEERRLGEEELKRYIEDVRLIRRTLTEAEGSYRMFAWFYHVMAALVFVAAAVNLVLVKSINLTAHEALVLIWIPASFLAGVAETAAWVMKSNREKVPVFTVAFARYMVAYTGVLIGLFTLAFLLIRPGFPAPGVTLLLVGMTFCLPLQYTHFGFVLEALILVAIGLLFVLMDVQGTVYFVADAILITIALVGAGIIESILTKRDNHG